MKIAIIGSGISGLTAAYMMNRKHEITVFEAEDRLGGHTATIDVDHDKNRYAIDTGFIVFNDWTYPNFKTLLKKLDVSFQKTDMGFSVSCDESGLEYSGNNINTLFAQRRNLFKPSHWFMIKDILRFNKEAIIDVESNGIYSSMTLGDYLIKKNYSAAFTDKYLIPMGAAIWSASTQVITNFSLQFFVRFFRNHGLLSVSDRPQWHVIKGGSRSYIAPLVSEFQDKIRLNTRVNGIKRVSGKVEVSYSSGSVFETSIYDQIVIACHSDQALAMLSDATEMENKVLSAIPYQKNEVVLHTDASVLPKKRSTWSSWNYRIVDRYKGLSTEPPALTYNMNILQSLNAKDTFCVTLNNIDVIDPQKIIGTFYYDHPVFSMDSLAAQKNWDNINGVNNTWFCGAYWGNGFHEDGVVSALRVARSFGETL